MIKFSTENHQIAEDVHDQKIAVHDYRFVAIGCHVHFSVFLTLSPPEGPYGPTVFIENC